MSEQKHNKGDLVVDKYGRIRIYDPVGNMPIEDMALVERDIEFIERSVACVNALKGVKNPSAVKGLKSLLQAAHEAIEWHVTQDSKLYGDPQEDITGHGIMEELADAIKKMNE